MISFRAIGLIICLSDLAGGRDPLVAYAGMSRVNAGPYGAAQDARVDAIWGPADSHGDFALRGAPVGGRLKRAMDIALAGVSLALLAPMFLVIAALLHVCFGRPVFMARQRVGFAGRSFTAFAFSTAPTDAASQLATCVVGLLRELRPRPSARADQRAARRHELRWSAADPGRSPRPLSAGLPCGEARPALRFSGQPARSLAKSLRRPPARRDGSLLCAPLDHLARPCCAHAQPRRRELNTVWNPRNKAVSAPARQN